MDDEKIDVPPGLKGVVAAETTIGDVRGLEGRFHYRDHDATELARHCALEEVWFLLTEGRLPDPDELAAFSGRLQTARTIPTTLLPALEVITDLGGPLLTRLRSALSLAAAHLGCRPVLDLDPDERRADALRLAALTPSLVAALWRLDQGLPLLERGEGLGHAADYLYRCTGERPDPAAARAVEQYLILTIDHGFNASTFTGRVVASTGADVGAALVAALGALSGPLHGGAPSRALAALDEIGTPERAAAWVTDALAAGDKIMGFGHAVYRAPDPRSGLLLEIARSLGGERVEQAVAIEAAISDALRAAKPGQPIPTNVEFYAGVVMERCGLAADLFTPTFAVSRVIGWSAHVVEQAAAGKIIRPAARYVGPWPLEPVAARS